MDMIGRLKEKKLIVGGVGTAQEWRSMIDADNSVQGMTVSLNSPISAASATLSAALPIVLGSNGQPVVTLDPAKPFDLTLNEDGYGPSDHSSFYAKQVPVLFFSGPAITRIITSLQTPPTRSTTKAKHASSRSPSGLFATSTGAISGRRTRLRRANRRAARRAFASISARFRITRIRMTD